MHLNLSNRFIISIQLLIVLCLAAPFSFAAAAKGQQAQAQVLDHAETYCSNCFFGATDYYYCFAVDNKILIGVQRVPVVNWQDSSKNYLTKYHRQWKPWDSPGQTVPITYDDKHIWVSRTAGQQATDTEEHSAVSGPFRAVRSLFGGGGKDVRLDQTSSRDLFTNNDRCRSTSAASAH
ncbi:MAG TPA: hypothetical protein VGK48_18575 [Terriglobia bacterium]|jgi:hypothetical protein